MWFIVIFEFVVILALEAAREDEQEKRAAVAKQLHEERIRWEKETKELKAQIQAIKAKMQATALEIMKDRQSFWRFFVQYLALANELERLKEELRQRVAYA